MAKEIQNLWREVRELSLGIEIDRLDSPPSPVQFLRDYVSQSKPCVISNAIAHWPALKLWSDPAYLAGALSNDRVSLHLTPNGCADAVTRVYDKGSTGDLCFASAHVEKLPFPEALQAVRSSSKGKSVAYLQQQNDCFRTEYSTVVSDCDGDIAWATEALGCSPEAVNLWIGTDLSVTSFHKDHYENLYAVVSGEKHFLLLPPTDVHRLYVQRYPAANYSYHRDTEAFKLELEQPMRHVPWCSVDPYPSPEREASERLKYPLFFNGPKPFRCTVKAGEILYLPSMWFHHVSQTPGDGGYTIAVNYWYDMQFDIKYAYFNFLQSVSYESSSLNPILSWREDEDSESGDAERVHVNAIKLRFESNGLIQSGLVEMYRKYGLVKDAEKLCRAMEGERSFSCRIVIVVSNMSGFHIKAIKLLYKMKVAGVEVQDTGLALERDQAY